MKGKLFLIYYQIYRGMGKPNISGNFTFRITGDIPSESNVDSMRAYISDALEVRNIYTDTKEVQICNMMPLEG